MAQGSDGLLIAELKTSPACVDAHDRDAAQASNIVSEFHEQSVPDFAAQALDRLSAACMHRFRIFV